MKKMFILLSSLSLIAACSTTPQLDKKFGEASKDSFATQKINTNRSSESLITSKEVKPAYDVYIKGQSSDTGNVSTNASTSVR